MGEDKNLSKEEKKHKVVLENPERLSAILFFALLFLYGCLVFRDYGISIDENVERNSSLVTYQYLNPSVKDIVTDSVNFQEVEELDTYTDRYYGVIVQLPTVLIEHLFGFHLPTRTVYLIRHFYTFLLFFLAVVVFYFLAKRLTKSHWLGLLGALMLVVSPRILAESFYNIKDIVFLSFVIYNLYAAVDYLERPGLKSGLALAAVSALCTNVRVVGAVVIFSAMATAFFKGLQEERCRRKKFGVSQEKNLWGGASKKTAGGENIQERSFEAETVQEKESHGKSFGKQCLGIVLVSLACVAIYIATLPVLWKNPVQELMNTVKTFSDFTNWDDIFLYRGFPVRGNNLPRSYLFVWIFISTPLLYLVLFGVGIVERLVGWVRDALGAAAKKEDLPEGFWCHVLLGMVLVIPLCYVVFRKPTLYNGWRHFYFLYGIILIYGAWGAGFLFRLARLAKKKKIWEGGLMGVIGLCMLSTLLWMGKNHPYEYMYFNPLVRSYAMESFELDYWAVSEKDMFQYICDHEEGKEIKVWCTYSDFDKSLLMLSEEDAGRLVYTASPMDADYAVCRDLMKSAPEQMERPFAFEPVHQAVVDGRVINGVYRRNQTLAAKSTVVVLEDHIAYSTAGLEWKEGQNHGGTAKEEILSDLGAQLPISMISVKTADREYLEGIQVLVSADGENWSQVPDNAGNVGYEYDGALFSLAEPVRYLKLAHEKGLKSGLGAGGSLALDVELFLPLDTETNISSGPISSHSIFERVSGHENPVYSANVIDGSMQTRWQSENIQKQGIAFDLVFNDVYSISGIRLDTGDAAEEYPRSLRIFVTTDNENWTELAVETTDNLLFTFPETQAKAIRLITGNMDGLDVQERWSIYELALLRRAE